MGSFEPPEQCVSQRYIHTLMGKLLEKCLPNDGHMDPIPLDEGAFFFKTGWGLMMYDVHAPFKSWGWKQNKNNKWSSLRCHGPHVDWCVWDSFMFGLIDSHDSLFICMSLNFGCHKSFDILTSDYAISLSIESDIALCRSKLQLQGYLLWKHIYSSQWCFPD